MRAQFTPLGAILIVAMVVSLISVAYVWSDVMVEKQKMIVDYKYAENKIDEMRDAVWAVSHAGGRQEVVDVNLERIWMVVNEEDLGKYGNSIDLIMDTQVDILEIGDWKGIDPDEEIGSFGLLGQDEMGVIMGRNDGRETILRLWYRDLFDTGSKKYYRVKLLKSNPWNLESDKQRIVFTNTGEERIGDYIVTEVTLSLR